jgi:hypothetical protein
VMGGTREDGFGKEGFPGFEMGYASGVYLL